MTLVARIRSWVEAHRRDVPAFGYAFTRALERPDLYGVIDAMVIRYSIGNWPPTDLEREQWTQFIRAFQDEASGQFIEDVTWHKPVHATAFATCALRMLDASPAYRLAFADTWKPPCELGRHLNGLDWARMRSESHRGGAIAAAFSMLSVVDAGWWQVYFDTLRNYLDPVSGLMATREPSVEALRGTFHYALLYAHHGRPWPYPQRLLDSIAAILDAGWPPDAPKPGGGELVTSFFLYFLAKQRREFQPRVRDLAERLFDSRLGAVVDDGWFEQHADNLHRAALLTCALAMMQKILPAIDFGDEARIYLDHYPWI